MPHGFVLVALHCMNVLDVETYTCKITYGLIFFLLLFQVRLLTENKIDWV